MIKYKELRIKEIVLIELNIIFVGKISLFVLR